MLGDPKNLNQMGLLASAKPDKSGFVEVRPRQASYEPFALNQERVEKLTQVVQFLERQQYDVKETATQVIAQEAAAEQQKI